MTGRTLAFIASGVLLVAVVALAVLPLLSHHSPRPAPASDVSPSVDPTVDQLAQRTARADLRCPTSRSPSARPTSRPTGCGTLHIARSQTSCTSATRCTVDLIGDLQTSRLVVPIALTMTLTNSGAAWRVSEVAS